MVNSRAALLGFGTLFLCGMLLGLPELMALRGAVRLPLQLVTGLCTAAILLALSRRPIARSIPVLPVLVVAFFLALAVALTAAAIWPNSGDEYGYLYVTRTLLAGRFYNPLPPVPELFDFFWIAAKDGKTASQYAPGWPAFLAPFFAAGMTAFANPLLLVALGCLLLATLRRIGASQTTCAGLLTLILLAPFTIFNAASLFNHLLSAVAVMGVCWLQLRDEQGENFWNKVGLGVFLSVALVTRNEVFALTLLLLGFDILLRRRLKAFQAVIPVVVGALPLTLLWLIYTAAITGSPFRTTQAWVAPQELAFGLPPLYNAADKQATYLLSLLAFTSIPLLLIYLNALWTKLRSSTIRFYDALLPAAILFFVFYPAAGGHQYGPRYWFFAWPAVALTIGSASAEAGGFIKLWRWRVHLPTLAVLQSAAYLSFIICFAVFLRDYVDNRRAVYATGVPVTPAIVLVPERQFRMSRWQAEPFKAEAQDFTRNDLDFHNPVLYGRGDHPRFARIACSIPDRHVYLWEEPGTLRSVDCPPQRP